MPILAILPDGSEVVPTSVQTVFHGTSNFDPSVAFKSGIPEKGKDCRLLEHVLGNSDSAFRGATTEVTLALGQGAAYWAGIGGWVYYIDQIESWHVEKELEGRVPNMGGFTGAPNVGECEHAIPSKVGASKLHRVGLVEAGRPTASGERLLVRNWKKNPYL